MQDVHPIAKYTNLLFQKSTLPQEYKNEQTVNYNSWCLITISIINFTGVAVALSLYQIGYGPDGPGYNSQDKIFLFPRTFRPALESTQPPIQWALASFRG